MALHQKLGLSARLSQRLILTPSLQQAIKLLPLTTLELAEVLEQEVMENPLLEEVPLEETKTSEEIAQEAQAEPQAERERAEDPLKDIEVERFFEDYFDDGGGERRMRPAEVPEVPPIENTLTESLDLYDYLLWQLHMTETGRAHARDLRGDRAEPRRGRPAARHARRRGGRWARGRWKRSRRRSPTCRRSTRPASPRGPSPSACASSCACWGSRARPPT